MNKTTQVQNSKLMLKGSFSARNIHSTKGQWINYFGFGDGFSLFTQSGSDLLKLELHSG